MDSDLIEKTRRETASQVLAITTVVLQAMSAMTNLGSITPYWMMTIGFATATAVMWIRRSAKGDGGYSLPGAVIWPITTLLIFLHGIGSL
ncbi:MAG: hypothetical protein JWN37_782 [Candidatus Nomurabacteria bacterium]|nr:hypothetical protein [Candidatus Nomurabacteria bacterium]